MERLTTYHAGKAVIKDKSRLSEAMEKLAKYEEWEENEYKFYRIIKIYDPTGQGIPVYVINEDTISKSDVIGKTIFLTYADVEKVKIEYDRYEKNRLEKMYEEVMSEFRHDDEVEV